MTPEQQFHEAMTQKIDYEHSIIAHNRKILKRFGKNAKRDFSQLIDYCQVTDRIQLVDGPEGEPQNEDCGIFKQIHVEQWPVGCEGDSFDGFIYAKVNNKQWIKTPYSC